MRARQDADFRRDRAHGLGIAAVDTLAGVEHRVAHHIGFDVMEQILELVLRKLAFVFADEFLRRAGTDIGDLVAAQMLFRNLKGGCQLGARPCLDLLEHRLVFVHRHIARFLRRFLGKPDDTVDHRLHGAVAKHHGAQHRLLVQLLRFGFHHQHGIGGAGDNQIEFRVRHLIDRRVEHVGAFDQTDAGPTDRAHERDTGKCERRRRGHNRHDVRIVLHVVAEHGDDHLGFVAIAFGEQRPDGAID